MDAVRVQPTAAELVRSQGDPVRVEATFDLTSVAAPGVEPPLGPEPASPTTLLG